MFIFTIYNNKHMKYFQFMTITLLENFRNRSNYLKVYKYNSKFGDLYRFVKLVKTFFKLSISFIFT